MRPSVQNRQWSATAVATIPCANQRGAIDGVTFFTSTPEILAAAYVCLRSQLIIPDDIVVAPFRGVHDALNRRFAILGAVYRVSAVSMISTSRLVMAAN
jgi:hypothetical protein